MKPLVSLSVSQVATWEFCPRKWAFDRLMPVKPPSTPQMEFGKKVHAELENFLRFGKPFTEPLASAVWDKTTEHIDLKTAQAEQMITIPVDELTCVPVRGIIDLYDGNYIVDYKIGTSALWTKPKIANNLQLATYAFAMDSNYVAWCVGNPNTGKIRWVEHKVTAEYLDAAVLVWWTVAPQMQEHALLPPEKVPCNRDVGKSCYHFGRVCEHQTECIFGKNAVNL